MANELLVWVKKQLKVRDVSERELARRAGVSNTMVSNILGERRPITFDFCKVVSKGFDEPIWNVLQMAGFIDDVPKSLTETEEIKKIITKYNKLSPEGKKEFNKFLDWLMIKE